MGSLYRYINLLNNADQQDSSNELASHDDDRQKLEGSCAPDNMYRYIQAIPL